MTSLTQRPVRVQLLGVLPMTYRTCAHGADLCAPADMRDQLMEYPAHVQAQQEVVEAAARALWDDFGQRVRVESVPLTTLHGAWLAFRHQLGADAVALVNGAGPLPLTQGYQALRDAVRRCLAAGEEGGASAAGGT